MRFFVRLDGLYGMIKTWPGSPKILLSPFLIKSRNEASFRGRGAALAQWLERWSYKLLRIRNVVRHRSQVRTLDAVVQSGTFG